jgi:hypothetical protein
MIKENPKVTNSVRYELFDKDGIGRGTFYNASMAAEAAKRLWPEQSQDPDRAGIGWDVQVVGS